MKQISLHLLIGEAVHQSGNRVFFPLHLPHVVRLNTSPEQLARQVSKAIHEKLLKKGLYSQILQFITKDDLMHQPLTVTLDASQDQLFPELKLPFDSYYFQNESGQFIGFVPLLSLESAGTTLDELIHHLTENIRLEFIRKKRLQSVRSLLTTQWYSDLTLHRVPVDFPFYTLSEIEKMAEAGKEQLLPEVAQKMQATAGDLMGLSRELEKLIQALKGYNRSSVLIVGDSGKGKTALVREFVALRHQHGLGGTSVWEASAAQLLHRLTAQGSWEEYLAYVCNELRNRGDLLYISNLSELFEVGQYSGNNMSFADYLRDYIARGEITVISECTPEELAQIELRSPGYAALFTQVKLEELSRDTIRQIVVQKVEKLSRARKITLDPAAILEVLRLQQWYSPYSGLPGKTIRFLSAVLSESEPGSHLTKSDMYVRFCQETGMPEFMINPDSPLDVAAMEAFFQQNIYGQEEAIATVLDVLVSIKAAVIRRGKPLASLLFVGPTGVGKTEMAKVLAEFMFGNRQKMIRFDMSEYADYQSILRLTGDMHASGEGLLTAAVRQEPFSVLLFDELEKVHPSFYDLLLQILGEGRLTDSRGRVADFCSTIIILTSNIGARSYQTGTIGFIETKDQKDVATAHFTNEVQNFFRPELFNRLDRILAFSPLEKRVVRLIVDREMELVKKREGINSRNLRIDVDRSVLDYLGTEGYNWAYGARFLQRTIQEKLVIPLAEHLNQYDFETPLEISISQQGKTVAFQLARRHEMSLAEKAISKTDEITVVEFTNEVTRNRRATTTIRNGSYYAHFLSRLDQLERKLQKLTTKKQEEKFWQDEPQSKRYYELTGIRNAFDEATRQIQRIESENFLLLNGLDVDIASLYPAFLSWHQRFQELKVKLVQMENPELMKCTLCIYGHAANLFSIADIYLSLSTQRGFKVQAYQIWHNNQEIRFTEDSWKRFQPHNLYADITKQPFLYLRYPYNEPLDDDYALVGVEIELTGNLPFLYFKGESGYHFWKTPTGEERKYLIQLSAQPFNKFQTPGGIHRKNTFEGHKARRQYSVKGFQDLSYDVVTTSSQHAKALADILKKQFELAVDKYLL